MLKVYSFDTEKTIGTGVVGLTSRENAIEYGRKLALEYNGYSWVYENGEIIACFNSTGNCKLF